MSVGHLVPNTATRTIYVLWEVAPRNAPRAVASFSVGRSHRRKLHAAALPVPYSGSAKLTLALGLERGPRPPSSPTLEVAAGTT
ncbi:MAG: hypothetical protein M0Z87_00560 [Actinomycetota bacterium]|nr:hypothetical protein [Actinomycetota bacterium]